MAVKIHQKSEEEKREDRVEKVLEESGAVVAVAAGVLLLGFDQASFGLSVLVNAFKAGRSHMSARRGSRFVSLNSHLLVPP